MSISQGAMTGASIGGQASGGNPYAIAAGAIIGAFLGNQKANEEQEFQRKQMEYVKELNTNILKEQSRHSAEVARQNRYMLEQTRQALDSTAQQRSILDGAAKAAMGSVEMVGNSMQHVLSDYVRQQSAADAQILYNVEQQTANLNNSLADIANRARGSFRDPVDAWNTLMGKQTPQGGGFMDMMGQVQGMYQGRTAAFNTQQGGAAGGGFAGGGMFGGMSGGGGGSMPAGGMDNLF